MRKTPPSSRTGSSWWRSQPRASRSVSGGGHVPTRNDRHFRARCCLQFVARLSLNCPAETSRDTTRRLRLRKSPSCKTPSAVAYSPSPTGGRAIKPMGLIMEERTVFDLFVDAIVACLAQPSVAGAEGVVAPDNVRPGSSRSDGADAANCTNARTKESAPSRLPAVDDREALSCRRRQVRRRRV